MICSDAKFSPVEIRLRVPTSSDSLPRVCFCNKMRYKCVNLGESSNLGDISQFTHQQYMVSLLQYCSALPPVLQADFKPERCPHLCCHLWIHPSLTAYVHHRLQAPPHNKTSFIDHFNKFLILCHLLFFYHKFNHLVI